MPVRIEQRLPSYYGPKDAPELGPLVGSTIVAIGAPVGPKRALEGGGLGIEYRRPGSDRTELLLLAFNELGIWVENR